MTLDSNKVLWFVVVPYLVLKNAFELPYSRIILGGVFSIIAIDYLYHRNKETNLKSALVDTVFNIVYVTAGLLTIFYLAGQIQTYYIMVVIAVLMTVLFVISLVMFNVALDKLKYKFNIVDS